MSIVIVDFKMGNVGSIENMIRKVGGKAEISGDLERIRSAAKLILPGVGAFDTGMSQIRRMGLEEGLHEQAVRGTPILGICLGMQLLLHRSEEGKEPGLGWIDGECIRFRVPPANKGDYRVPHMGWNSVVPTRADPLFSGQEENLRFYFVHSYHAVCQHEENVLARTNYINDFASVIQRGNIWGTQFHPEKSHRFGMNLIRNFVNFSQAQDQEHSSRYNQDSAVN